MIRYRDGVTYSRDKIIEIILILSLILFAFIVSMEGSLKMKPEFFFIKLAAA